MAKIQIEIRDDINPSIAVQCVKQVIDMGRISHDSKGGEHYCWATRFASTKGNLVVSVRPYTKNDCFVVYKER